LAKLRGAKVIVEFHEVLDTAEARLGPVRAYVGLVAPLLMRLASGFIVHTATDRPILEQKYRLRNRPVAVIPHGPYDHHVNGSAPLAEVPCDGCFRLLYFGVVRPYKGVEDLVRAFNALPRVEAENYWLTVVGEVWEGWDLPARLIESSPYRDRITFVDRYVRDDEVAGFFASADAVVLPYHRSSASGPLHTAMSHGLPVITTKVGGLPEAVAGYDGALMVPPQDSDALCEALQRVRGLRGQRFADPHSWDKIVTRYAALFGEIGAGGKKV
jgi:glycosyltransferase involved in cell wall biosynthesis